MQYQYNSQGLCVCMCVIQKANSKVYVKKKGPNAEFRNKCMHIQYLN